MRATTTTTPTERPIARPRHRLSHAGRVDVPLSAILPNNSYRIEYALIHGAMNVLDLHHSKFIKKLR